MHKGFAFVQFTNPFDARSACVGEDARTVLGQTLGNYIMTYIRIVRLTCSHQFVFAKLYLFIDINNYYYATAVCSEFDNNYLAKMAAAHREHLKKKLTDCLKY